ncbi:helix-turn-helix transcriptional regulator [Vibrio furnissii]|uniref:helix-turn-helix transcriptional regulator n=1 Tax=Vibrio furnissii TaxID=29494 RepID=UPI003AA83E85
MNNINQTAQTNHHQTVQRLLTYSDVCEITNRSRKTIWAKVQNNSFPRPVKQGNRTVGWRQSDIELWINSNIGGSANA